MRRVRYVRIKAGNLSWVCASLLSPLDVRHSIDEVNSYANAHYLSGNAVIVGSPARNQHSWLRRGHDSGDTYAYPYPYPYPCYPTCYGRIHRECRRVFR
jgi:hypothetical protein